MARTANIWTVRRMAGFPVIALGPTPSACQPSRFDVAQDTPEPVKGSLSLGLRYRKSRQYNSGEVNIYLACTVRGDRGAVIVARALVRLHDQVEVFELAQGAIQGGRPDADMAVGAGGDLLHDGVAVTRAVGERQENMEDLRLQRQKMIDAARSVRHGGNTPIW